MLVRPWVIQFYVVLERCNWVCAIVLFGPLNVLAYCWGCLGGRDVEYLYVVVLVVGFGPNVP